MDQSRRRATDARLRATRFADEVDAATLTTWAHVRAAHEWADLAECRLSDPDAIAAAADAAQGHIDAACAAVDTTHSPTAATRDRADRAAATASHLHHIAAHAARQERAHA